MANSPQEQARKNQALAAEVGSSFGWRDRHGQGTKVCEKLGPQVALSPFMGIVSVFGPWQQTWDDATQVANQLNLSTTGETGKNPSSEVTVVRRLNYLYSFYIRLYIIVNCTEAVKVMFSGMSSIPLF
jgi:hypothetical protein